MTHASEPADDADEKVNEMLAHAVTLKTMIHAREDLEPCICAECRALAYVIAQLSKDTPA